MKLLTYGITFEKENLSQKFELLWSLYNEVLVKDRWWFYAFHSGGITLRCLSSSKVGVESVLKRSGVSYKLDRKRYTPDKNEYYGVHILSWDIVRLFHDMSVIYVKYGPQASFRPLVDRLTHMSINMRGVYDFEKESDIYLEVAEGRRKLVNKKLTLPKWLYKLWYRTLKFTRTHD